MIISYTTALRLLLMLLLLLLLLLLWLLLEDIYDERVDGDSCDSLVIIVEVSSTAIPQPTAHVHLSNTICFLTNNMVPIHLLRMLLTVEHSFHNRRPNKASSSSCVARWIWSFVLFWAVCSLLLTRPSFLHAAAHHSSPLAPVISEEEIIWQRLRCPPQVSMHTIRG